MPAKGKAIVKKSASGWPTGGRRMSDRAGATHRHRSRCRRRTARARASDFHPLDTKVSCLSWWALACPRERQPENIRSRSAIEPYVRTRHELAPANYSPFCSCAVVRRTRPVLEPDRARTRIKRGTTRSLLVPGCVPTLSLLVPGCVPTHPWASKKKTRTRPWAGQRTTQS